MQELQEKASKKIEAEIQQVPELIAMWWREPVIDMVEGACQGGGREISLTRKPSCTHSPWPVFLYTASTALTSIRCASIGRTGYHRYHR